MKIDILFVSDKGNVGIKAIRSLLSSIKDVRLDGDVLQFKEDKIKYATALSKGNKYVHLSLELEGNNKKTASTLSNLKSAITKGKHRAPYKITISYDESKNYMNYKLYSFIAENEVKLRQLIYLILLDSLGTKWVDELDSDDCEKSYSILHCNESKLVEIGLEAFSYYQYITFLFEKRPNKFSDESFLLDVINQIEKTSEIDKRELLCLLNSSKGYSLWEKYFSNIEYSDLNEDIELIRKIRNDVMHNRDISIEKFEAHKKLLQKSNKGLSKAIEYVKNDSLMMFDEKDVQIALDFSLICERFKSQIDWGEVNKRFSGISKNCNETFMEL